MAEYKGLTIRIGGDTTQLTRALSAAQQAARKTQSELTGIGKAIKFDPTSVTNMTTKMSLMSDKMTSLQSKAITLKDGISQLSNEVVNVGKGNITIGELAKQTDNAQLAAQRARERYNNLNAQLEEQYRIINNLARASEKYSKSYDIRKTGNIDQQIKDLREAGVITDDVAKKVTNLRSAWQQASNSNDAYRMVAQLEQMNVDLQRTTSEARSLSGTLSQLRVPPQMSQEFDNATNRIAELNSQSQRAFADLERMGEGLKLDPSNVEMTKQAVADLGQIIDDTKEKQKLLQSQIDELDAKGYGKIAESAGDVTLATERTEAELEGVQGKISTIKGHIDSLKTKQAACNTETEEGAKAYDTYGHHISTATEYLSRMEAKQQKLTSDLKDLDGASLRGNLKSQLQETTTYMDKLTKATKNVSSGKTSISEVSDEIKNLGKNASEADAQVTNLSKFRGLQNVGLALTGILTAPIMQIGRYSIQAANDIDSAYRDMRKTVDGTEQDFENLRQSAIEFSETHVTSADQILEIQAIGGELGIATDSLGTFSKTVSNIDIATNLDAETAATDLGHLSNIMDDLDEESMPEFSDALVRLGNNGASTETEIMDIATHIGSMGSIIGMSTPQVLAWASSIASTGQNSEAAGTAISKTMSNIEEAVAQGGDALQGFADVSQMTAEEFANLWKSDPSAAMEAFVKGLKNIKDTGGSVDQTLENLGITGVRQKQALEGLTQTIGGLDDNLQMSEDAWNGVSDQWGEAGDAAREADAKAQGFSGTISQIKNIAQDFGAEIGEAMIPALHLLRDALQGAYDIFKAMPYGVKVTITGLGALAAASGPVILAISQIGQAVARLKGVQKVTSLMGRFGEAAKVARSGAGSLAESLDAEGLSFDSLVSSINPAKLAIAGIGAIAIVAAQQFAEWKKESEDLQGATEGLKKATQDTTALDHYKATIEDIGESAKTTKQSVNDMLESNSERAKEMQQVTDEAETQIGTLNTIQKYIDAYAGKTDLTAEQQGKLAWAIEQCNDQFGLSLTMEDAINGFYTDQNGNVQDLKKSIDELVASKKEEARVNALSQNLTTAYQAQADAAESLAQAQKDYNDYYKELVEYYNGDEEKARSVADNSIFADNMEKAQEAYDAATDSVSDYEEELGTAAEAASDASDEFAKCANSMSELFKKQLENNGHDTNISQFTEDIRALGVDTEALSDLSDEKLRQIAEAYDGTAASIIPLLDKWGIGMSNVSDEAVSLVETLEEKMPDAMSAFEEAGGNVLEFAQACSDAGITAEQFADITKDDFTRMAKACNGNTQAMIWMIQHYNDTPIFDKDGNVQVEQAELVDAQGNVYVWNGTELINKETNAKVDQAELVDAQGNVYVWNGTELINKKTNAKVDQAELIDAQGNAYKWNGSNLKRQKTDVRVKQAELIGAQGNVYKWNGSNLKRQKTKATVTGNLPEALAALKAWNSITPRIQYAITKVKTERLGLATGGIRTHAAGGITTSDGIRRHAAGFVATRPTMISSRDLVGEAGAEAIVPLTNKHYSQPFADLIASEVSKHIPSSGNVYNLYLDDLRINDDAAIETHFEELMSDLVRLGVLTYGNK